MNRHIAKEQLESFIQARNFSNLFIELGWDKEQIPTALLSISLPNGNQYKINRVAEKRGFVVCVCDAGKDYPTSKIDRRRLHSKLAQYHYEHLLIICGENKQCWTVSIRPQNRPLRTIEVEWNEKQDIQPLMGKLDGMIFGISEEDALGITDVVERVRHAFMENSEKVTKKFYGEFQKNLSEFAGFIEGIESQVSKEWYAALMLNRLMFIYFIQKKHFLNGDVNYLENRLAKIKSEFGDDKFHDKFYRRFLRRLFTEGLGTPQADRDSALNALLGKVPYLNGGLFDLHEVEHDNHDITIPDQAFTNLFAFFGKYNWHLDSRMTASGKDINPDVIGYIFEKYINDRAAMGAYYTQEDVTGYIARNTIIPFLLNRAKKKCKNAFDAENGIWRFLRENPDNYIYDAVKKGCELLNAEIPENIHCGLDASKPNLLERRKDWNTPTAKEFALPTEIWRETIARRTRYFSLIEKIKNGEVHEIDDLITYNLDIERFAADALRWYEGSDFIDVFYAAIAGKKGLKSNQKSTRGITVLDPACGSGAFLFAALNILEPLYKKCVERMRDFVEEDDQLRAQGKRKGMKKHGQFRVVIDDINTHQNERYWIYKTIILNNLYGVDLMKEASEIAKLRLFLKLAAEAEYKPNKSNLGLEPLPDIDFNIRSGNSLVGFASMKQFEEVVTTNPKTGQKRLDISDGLTDEIREKAGIVRLANDRFRHAQDVGGEDYRQAKIDLGDRLALLNAEMHRYLAKQYGVDEDQNGKLKKKPYEKWLESHQPFHWLAEFYGIVEEDGGFDVVIGNPPYIKYQDVKKEYTVKDYQTESCRNLYAMFIERTIQNTDTIGMIVQLPLICTDLMIPAQNLLTNKRKNWIASFDDSPAKLFPDLVHIRATIFLSVPTKAPQSTIVMATKYHRWYSQQREILFHQIAYGNITGIFMKGTFPKIEDRTGNQLMRKLKRHDKKLRVNTGDTVCYFHNAPQYWIHATDFIPYFWNERDGEKKSTQIKPLLFNGRHHALSFCALINSSLFYWWFIVHSDCRHLNMREIENFSFSHQEMKEKIVLELSKIADDLMNSYRKNAVRKEANYKTTGKVIYDEFYPRHSKAIIDKIDTILAEHYNFTEEELDYIINYDIKYRMGLGK